MWETENIKFECFAAQKCTIIIIDHNVWIIIRLYEKTLEETEQTGYVFSYLLSIMLNSLFGIFSSCVWQTRRGK